MTEVDIDEGLLDQAKALLGTTTTEATVHAALEELVALRRHAAALDELAGVELDDRATTSGSRVEALQARD
ncbi:type II toxin-antitoxin system VapB family antitoxin [Klenkia terrae]|jgi:Arc/MetJ family transcription regulator|uniref:Type II toxin-antitoxin system VapB family antitoxin n=1 Tax=Klenkia terrae TaxID=1052259 RepID=A0ABU8E624_9ACTN|nr:type II toxin-antitoxin system VapB family antitoxin [Klenkia terrae]SSC25226.1 Bacterial antitoxin of type II TA system, VapB [Klenkia terrae]